MPVCVLGLQDCLLERFLVRELRNMISTDRQCCFNLPLVYHIPSYHFLLLLIAQNPCCLALQSLKNLPNYNDSLFPTHNIVVYSLYFPCIFALVVAISIFPVAIFIYFYKYPTLLFIRV